jgi:hypothetical protein
MTDPTNQPGGSNDPTVELSADEVAHLAAERDALAAEVERLSHREGRGTRWTNRARRITAGVLVVLFAISFLAAGVGAWLHRTTLNNDVWEERVVPLGEDPEVQAALANYTTEQLMTTLKPEQYIADALPDRASILAVPLASAVRTFVSDRVDEFFASSRFEDLWRAAATKSHEQAVAVLRGEASNIDAQDDRVVINLIPVINTVLAQVTEAAPGLVGSDVTLPEVTVDDVPAQARERLGEALGVDLGEDFGTFTVFDGGQLKAAQDAVALFDRLVILFAFLTVALPIAALWVSPRRRRTLLQLLGAAALMCIILRRVLFMLSEQVLDQVKEVNRAAADVVLSAVVDPVTNAAGTVLWVVAIIALVAVVTGPYPWVVSMRSSLLGTASGLASAADGRMRDPQTLAWIVSHADALRLAGYGFGVVMLWFLDLTWLTFLLVAALVAGWQVFLNRVAPPADDSGEQPPLGPPGTPQPAG